MWSDNTTNPKTSGVKNNSMITRTRAEYGGFLPLELNEGQEYFKDYSGCLRRYNSVKAALYYLIDSVPIKHIYIPYYYCPTTTQAIKNTGIDVSFYHITPDLLPEELPYEADSAVLLVNYFGVRSEKINSLASCFSKAVVVVDNAHAFFTDPFIAKGIYQLYSAKKFFGIPDGAYLIGEGVSAQQEPPGYSYEYADYLLLTYEAGTNAAYGKKKSADSYIGNNPGTMSALSVGLLGNVDYTNVRKKRESNFRCLNEKLSGWNELSLPEVCAAYQYPLYIPAKGRELKRKLIEKKIYVPTLWRGEDLMRDGNAFELSMSDDAVFLPVDQRYDDDDMNYIADTVLSLR